MVASSILTLKLHGVFSSDHALIYIKLLCPKVALHQLFIIVIENVHGAVSNDCKEISSLEIA